jgi:hypothetical protein
MDPQLFAEGASLLVRNHDSLRMRLTSARDEDSVPLPDLLRRPLTAAGAAAGYLQEGRSSVCCPGLAS